MNTEAIRAVLEDLSWVKDPSTKYSHGVISENMLSVARVELAALEADNARMRVALYKICDIEEGRSPGGVNEGRGCSEPSTYLRTSIDVDIAAKSIRETVESL